MVYSRVIANLQKNFFLSFKKYEIKSFFFQLFEFFTQTEKKKHNFHFQIAKNLKFVHPKNLFFRIFTLVQRHLLNPHEVSLKLPWNSKNGQSFTETGCQKYVVFGMKSARSTVSFQTGFIFLFYCRTVSLENWQIKMTVFVTVSLSKLKFIGQVSWNCDTGIKCWNCQIRPEKNWRPNWQFQHFSQITVSWNCPKIQLWHRNCTKNCHFYRQFQVKLTTKKKEPGFHLKPWWFQRSAPASTPALGPSLGTKWVSIFLIFRISWIPP